LIPDPDRRARRGTDLKDQLASDRSDGVRSSSRHCSEQLPWHVRCRAMTRCSEIAYRSRAARSNLGAILPLHDFRYQNSAHAQRILRSACGRGTCSLRTSRTPAGGARRDRTDDLLLAKQALSQLSYGPAGGQSTEDGAHKRVAPASVVCRVIMVGLGRFELPTSRLSSARSNQLSYKPVSGSSHQQSGITQS
jgi:hypothetical protein